MFPVLLQRWRLRKFRSVRTVLLLQTDMELVAVDTVGCHACVAHSDDVSHVSHRSVPVPIRDFGIHPPFLPHVSCTPYRIACWLVY